MMPLFECPNCGEKATATTAPNCGDCLCNHVEIVQMRPVTMPRLFAVKRKRTSTRERDTQRHRVYKADEATKPFDAADVSSVQLMERYVRRVWASKRMRDAFPKMGPESSAPKVFDGRGRRRAGGNSAMITMPTWSRREGIVLHELAHTITARCYSWQVAAHGWQYCHVYLHLVLYMMGREAHDALKAAMKANRVRFTAPRKSKPLTDEQRAALVARLEIARAARKAPLAA